MVHYVFLQASSHTKTLDTVGANIFVGNLDAEVDEKLLYDTFSAFGVILQPPKIMRDMDTGNSKVFLLNICIELAEFYSCWHLFSTCYQIQRRVFLLFLFFFRDLLSSIMQVSKRPTQPLMP